MALNHEQLEQAVQEFSLFDWMLEHYIIPKTGEPYSFVGHAYLMGIAQDPSPNIVIQKPAQVGLSEIAVAKGLYVADHLGLNAIYALPAMEQMRHFSRARVHRAIMLSPHIRSRVSGAENVAQKEIGEGLLYLIGSQDYRQLITIDGDCLIVDEVDGHLQENIPTLEQRIEHSNLRWRHYASTPTVPEYGINQMYLESDQREWFIACECCGFRQTLDWDQNVVEMPEPHVVCRNCRKPLNRLATGEWVPRFPSRSKDCHGYQVTKLSCERADVAAMWKRSKSQRHREQFYKSDLGQPFVNIGGRITRDEVTVLCTEPEPPSFPDPGWLTIAGVDVGPNELYVGIDRVLIDKSRRAILRTRIEGSYPDAFSRLENLLKQWKVRCAVVDAQPEARLVKEFAERSWGRSRIWRCYFHQIQEEYRQNPHEKSVQVNRTMACDAMVAAYRSQHDLLLPASLASHKEYVDQMQGPVRTTVDPNTIGMGASREAMEQKSIWAKTHRPDHYFYVETYLWVACDMAPSVARTSFVRL